MSDVTFTVHIFASTVALGASYAILMTILKKDINVAWLKAETLFVLLFTIVTLVATGMAGGSTISSTPLFIFGMLVLALSLKLSAFILFKVSTASANQNKLLKLRPIAVIIFVLYSIYWFGYLAQLAFSL